MEGWEEPGNEADTMVIYLYNIKYNGIFNYIMIDTSHITIICPLSTDVLLFPPPNSLTSLTLTIDDAIWHCLTLAACYVLNRF